MLLGPTLQQSYKHRLEQKMAVWVVVPGRRLLHTEREKKKNSQVSIKVMALLFALSEVEETLEIRLLLCFCFFHNDKRRRSPHMVMQDDS